MLPKIQVLFFLAILFCEDFFFVEVLKTHLVLVAAQIVPEI